MALSDSLKDFKQSVTGGITKLSLLINKLFSENENRKTDISGIQTSIGQLPTKQYVDNAVAGSTQIDDSTASPTKTWSSEKIDQKTSESKDRLDFLDYKIGDLNNVTTTVVDEIRNLQDAGRMFLQGGDDMPDHLLTSIIGWSAIKTQAKIAEAVSGLTSIDDVTVSPTKTFSSEKIMQKYAEIIGEAPITADTLGEISTQLLAMQQAEHGFITTTAGQSFTNNEILQAQSNLGLAVSINQNGDDEITAILKANIQPAFYAQAAA